MRVRICKMAHQIVRQLWLCWNLHFFFHLFCYEFEAQEEENRFLPRLNSVHSCTIVRREPSININF